MKRICIITPGGDAPGMNAAIRSIVRYGIKNSIEVFGAKRGYAGLTEGNIIPLNRNAVSGIIHQGGTILKTERIIEFSKEKDYIDKAYKQLKKWKIEGCIVIGGDGSFKGGLKLQKETGVSVVGIPASIDNDIYGTDETIGFDTACNTAVCAIDKIRDTATSYERVFIVEVMGKRRGFIAIDVAFGVGAEAVIIPEIKTDFDAIAENLKEGKKKGKKSAIIVLAEGAGKAHKIADIIAKKTGAIVRTTVLGYIQRGGAPTIRSRLLANLFGIEAVKIISSSNSQATMVGIRNGKIVSSLLEENLKKEKEIDEEKLGYIMHLAHS